MAARQTPGQQILGFVIDSLADGSKAALRSWIARRSSPTYSSPRATVGDSPPGASGCPFCFLAERLAVAYRFLRRAKSSPTFLRIYQELATEHITDASYLASTLIPDDHRDYALVLAITKVEAELSRPLAAGDLEPLLNELWSASEDALRIAERNQFGRPSAEQGPVVDGAAREVG